MPRRTTPTALSLVEQAPPRRYGGLTLAADTIGVSERTIRRWISDGTIAGYRVGPRLLRVDLDELEALVRPIPSAKS